MEILENSGDLIGSLELISNRKVNLTGVNPKPFLQKMEDQVTAQKKKFIGSKLFYVCLGGGILLVLTSIIVGIVLWVSFSAHSCTHLPF